MHNWINRALRVATFPSIATARRIHDLTREQLHSLRGLSEYLTTKGLRDILSGAPRRRIKEHADNCQPDRVKIFAAKSKVEFPVNEVNEQIIVSGFSNLIA
jgi:hypothetical protein